MFFLINDDGCAKKEITAEITDESVYHLVLFLNIMFYQFELQLAGIILLTAMAVGGISLWWKRRKSQIEQMEQNENEEQNL